jgi:ribosome-binding protein aMBF1 (putative translation factor)
MTRPRPDLVSETEIVPQVRLKSEDSPETLSPPRRDRWSELRAKTFPDAAARERYERKVKSIVAVRRMLQLIDSERERTGLSKSDLARRIGVSPATVRRLFTSPTSNPTLRTIVDLFTALDLDIEVRPRDRIPTPEDAPEASRLNAPAPSVTR